MISWSMPVSEEFDARPVRACPRGLTVLVGENGSGKSTVVESLAEAYGLNPQGGSAQGRLFRIRQFMRDPRSYFRHLFDG